jgi:hypothetical protein
MFCPNCKSEYRQGFTRCTDCDVNLVASLSSNDALEPEASEGERSFGVAGSPELLWDGSDREAFARVTAALQDAKIFFRASEQRTHLLYTSMWPSLEIWIHRADHDAATKLLSDLFGEDAPPIGPDLPGGELEDLKGGGVVPPRPTLVSWFRARAPVATPEEEDWPQVEEQSPMPENFDPEEAKVEVWSGPTQEMADNLKMCLRENGIGCVISDAHGKKSVCVLPSAEKRAREIVREIIEAVPPE